MSADELVPLPGDLECPRCSDRVPLEVELDAGAIVDVEGVPHVRPADVELLCDYCTAVFVATADGLQFVGLHGGS